MTNLILQFFNKGKFGDFTSQIAAGLDKALANDDNRIEPLSPIQLDQAESPRYIIFSDQHKGSRNGADDFQRSERAYNAALAHYQALGYYLIVLGDVEELWEERPQAVLQAYPYSLALEKAFHEAGRYYRAYGNHDDIWQYPDAVRKHLQPQFGPKPLKVYEGFTIPVKQHNRLLGDFFLVHGHQGTLTSDHFLDTSKWLVRHFWRPFQRLTKIRLTTPAKDLQLRQAHNIAMYAWAVHQKDLVLITGHTHYPVFEAKTHELQLEEELAALDQNKRLSHDEKVEARAFLAAQLAWVRTPQQKPACEGTKSAPGKGKPCYFNTGCCSFSDGDITGLEIADGVIRLVRWPDDDDAPVPKVLAKAKLFDIFNQLNGKRPSVSRLTNRSPQMIPW